MDWQAIVFLGAYHGINPGMGWLFAVALGMQQGSARGVWRALPPIALGHAGAVAVVVAIAAAARLVVPLAALNVLVAAVLMSLGVYRLWRHRHPRVGGMQVGFRDLTLWSFLMASAHGAGLMVLPFVMPTAATVAARPTTMRIMWVRQRQTSPPPRSLFTRPHISPSWCLLRGSCIESLV